MKIDKMLKEYRKIAADFRSSVGKGNFVHYGDPKYISAIEAYSQIDPGFETKFLKHVTSYKLFVYENHEKKTYNPETNLGVYLCNVF